MSEFVPEGWKLKTIGELANVKRGASPRPINDSQWWGGNVGWVRISDVTSSNKYLNKTTQYLSDLGVSKSVKIDKGEVVLSICATIGKPIIVNVDACIHDGFVWFNKLEKTIHREFWYYFLLSNQEFLASQRQSGTQGNLNTSIVSDLLCYLPPLPEQQKIAAILTSVDEVIEKTQAQINKLKDLKTGMMQELLTRGVGVDGKPHTEFKDSPVGRIPKAWEVVKLDNVATIQSGAAKSSKLTGDLIELPYLRVANVQDGYLNLAEIKTIMIPRNKSERFLLQNNDVLVNEGGDFDKLGRGSIWHSQITPCAHQNHVFVVRTDSKKLSPMFFNHLSGSEYGKKYYMGCAKQTTNLASINSTQLKQFPVLLPSLEEQDSICEVLDSVDQTIAKNQVKLAKNRNLKKALMQDLLTGKVRVKVDTE